MLIEVEKTYNAGFQSQSQIPAISVMGMMYVVSLISAQQTLMGGTHHDSTGDECMTLLG